MRRKLMFGRFDDCDEFEERVLCGYRYALSLSACQHEAEDVVQEAVTRLIRKYGEVKHKGHLYRTIRNIFYDQWRRNKVVQMETMESQDLEVVAGEYEDTVPGTVLDVETALEILRPEERELLYLRYRDGLSATEIGKLTGKQRGTILSSLYRAEKKMKAYFAEDFDQSKRKEASR